MMGDAVPQTPWDLSLSFSRMDVFLFTANGTCRTIERLDRKIGQRRDATRAPIQARNGWRPHGRRLGQPATPSKDGRNFVQTMGSTSEGAFRHWKGKERKRDELLIECAKLAQSEAARLFVSVMEKHDFLSLAQTQQERFKNPVYGGFETCVKVLASEFKGHDLHIWYDEAQEYAETCLKLY
ncbi:MAG: hypothetical protein WA738_01715, partial [Candidatus Angelobacter sp.]